MNNGIFFVFRFKAFRVTMWKGMDDYVKGSGTEGKRG